MTKGLNKFVANRMKSVRVSMGLTQADVADQMNMSQSMYSLLEGRRSNKLTVFIIEKFCTAYKVNPQWLFGNNVRVFVSDDLENTIGRKLKKKEMPLAQKQEAE